MLSNLSMEVYETIEADHEYEVLDKYNQEVLAPPPKPEPVQLQPLSSAPTNTNKPDTPTSTQQIIAQDDLNDK